MNRIGRMVSMAILGVLAAGAAPVLAAEEESGFQSIFNGKDLTGWDGKKDFWSVQDGAITGLTTKENPTKGNTFLVWTDGELDDFELRLKFKHRNHNSGVQYRSENLGDFVVKGYQADIDESGKYTGANYGEKTGRGLLAVRGEKVVYDKKGEKTVTQIGDPKELFGAVKPGDWNDYTIIARGNHLIQKINGRVMCEVIDDDPRATRSGILALQLHAGPPMKVQFKDIRLKRLKLAGNIKKLVMVGGRPSHGYGAHEFGAGCLLLKDCLDENTPGLLTAVYRGGWPKDPTAFDNADAILLFMDGGGGHPVNQHLAEIDRLMKQGVGLSCMHYGVEVPKGASGDRFLDWIGGYFEVFWSVNPHWMLEKTTLAADHPITRGVKPFAVNDEWYFHMRFRTEAGGYVPILSATPPDASRTRATGKSRGGNPAVLARKGQPEVLAWARQRPDGGRGFGFTGAHVHWNWANDDYRKLVLNSLVWVAGAEVPETGVASKTPTPEQMQANQDYPPPKNFDRVQLQQAIQRARGTKASTK